MSRNSPSNPWRRFNHISSQPDESKFFQGISFWVLKVWFRHFVHAVNQQTGRFPLSNERAAAVAHLEGPPWFVAIESCMSFTCSTRLAGNLVVASKTKDPLIWGGVLSITSSCSPPYLLSPRSACVSENPSYTSLSRRSVPYNSLSARFPNLLCLPFALAFQLSSYLRSPWCFSLRQVQNGRIFRKSSTHDRVLSSQDTPRHSKSCRRRMSIPSSR